MRGITYALTCIYDIMCSYIKLCTICSRQSLSLVIVRAQIIFWIYTVGLGAGLACGQYTTIGDED